MGRLGILSTDYTDFHSAAGPQPKHEDPKDYEGMRQLNHDDATTGNSHRQIQTNTDVRDLWDGNSCRKTRRHGPAAQKHALVADEGF